MNAVGDGGMDADRSRDELAHSVRPQATDPSTAHSSSSIQDYELVGFLGEGSTAHVYLAKHSKSGNAVAIKVMDKLYVRQAQMQHKVQREILLHATLHHAHIVRVVDAFEDSRNHYLALEFCAGGSVASLLRQMRGQSKLPIPMDEATVKSIVSQAAEGVEYLHQRGIIHRDLKLANLLLDGDSVVKISDFGLATYANEEHLTVCGTPNFIAPEILKANEIESATTTYDESVDIWSLGCILYTLLLGKPPYEGAKVSDTLANVSNASRRPLSFPKGFSATAGDLIKRMLNTNPRARPTISQVRAHPWLRPIRSTIDVSTTDDDADPMLAWSQRPLARSFRSTTKPRATVGQARGNRANTPATKRQPVQRRRGVEYDSDDSSLVGREEDESFSSLDIDGLELSSESSLSSDELEKAETIECDGATPTGTTTRSEVEEAKSSRAVDRIQEIPDETPKRSPDTSAPNLAAEIHFLRLRIEVSDVPWLGVDANAKEELFWDCWESGDIRQLTRFTLSVGACELEYVPSKAMLHGRMANGSSLKHHFGATEKASHPISSTDEDAVKRLVMLCQCLAMRSLQLRRAAMAVDIDELPITHFDAIPESVLTRLRRDSVRECVMNELRGVARESTAAPSSPPNMSLLSCSLPGVGVCELDSEGHLSIQFFSGPRLIVNGTGSVIQYRRCPGESDHEYDLSSTPFLPTEVKKYFEYIPTFVRQLKVPTKE